MANERVRECGWCGEPFKVGPVGRAAVYCKRGCRQRAYEARAEQRRTARVVLAVLKDQNRRRRGANSASSRDETSGPNPTRDETPGGGGDLQLW